MRYPWKKIFAPPVFPSGEETRQAAMLNVILWATLVVTTLANFSTLFFAGQAWLSLFSTVMVAGPILISLWLLHQRKVHLASWLFVLFIWLVISILVYLQGGLESPALPSFLLVVLVSGLLLGGRASYFFVGISVLMISYFSLTAQQGHLPAPVYISNIGIQWLGTTSAMIVLALLLQLALKNLTEALKSAQAAETRYKQLFESGPIMSIITKSVQDEPVIIDCNRLFLEVLGYQPEEVIGKPLGDFYSSESRDRLVQGGYRLALHGESIDEERILLTRDGRHIVTIVHTLPQVNANGITTGTVAMFTDISRRKVAEQQVQEYAELLERRVQERTALLAEQNEELNAFAHTVAHDLKNPLSQVMGFVELMELDLPENGSLRELMTQVSRGVNKMNSIINELLLLASVREENVVLEPVAMGDIVQEALFRLTSKMQEIQTELILPPHWPLAQGYAPWLEEVWANYLSNALKYGGRPARIELGATPQPDHTIRFWVRDNGPGLSEEQKQQVFDRFTRLDRSRATGHGLGLSIVRRIVEKLGGQVYVESEAGQGSTFGFVLPSAEVADLQK